MKGTIIPMESMFLVVRAERFVLMITAGHREGAKEWAKETIPDELQQEFVRILRVRLAMKNICVDNLLEWL